MPGILPHGFELSAQRNDSFPNGSRRARSWASALQRACWSTDR